MSHCQHESRTYILVLQSVWHWELWIAFPFGIGIGTVWMLTRPNPKWLWLLPVVTMSVAILGVVWHQWNALRAQLRDTPYGELVRIADRLQIEVGLPYVITIWLALGTILWSTVTTILIEDINDTWWEAMLVSVTSLLGMWLILSVASLVLLSMEHDRNMAEVASIREELDAAQRRHYAIRQTDGTNTQEIQKLDDRNPPK